MTVGYFKKMLENFDDSDRLIIDNGNYSANPSNEVIFAIKVRRFNEDCYRPVVILQTKNDFDIYNELDAQVKHAKQVGMSCADLIEELNEMGFPYDKEEVEAMYDGRAYYRRGRSAYARV